ncbi:MAG TPA: hypothetical protein PKE65_03395 [Rhizobiaceae bacterium]|nr:hypothetical protein [Rhizobiaceae bacterium]
MTGNSHLSLAAMAAFRFGEADFLFPAHPPIFPHLRAHTGPTASYWHRGAIETGKRGNSQMFKDKVNDGRFPLKNRRDCD